MTETTNVRIERALDIVGREIERTEHERDAFDRFLHRLSDLRPEDRHEPATPLAQAQAPVADTPAVGTNTDRITTAYRETVMSTPHYEEEYDEPFEAEVTAEFGPGLAQLLTEADRISLPHYRALRCGARHSRSERQSFLSVLREERESLETIDTRLSGIESRAFELRTGPREEARSGPERSLGELRQACTTLIDRRQETIHSRSVSAFAGIDTTSLVRYLYDGFDETCPALADILDVYRNIDRSGGDGVPGHAD